MLLGIGLLIVGIVGLIVPIMPGWIFVIPGLLILGDYFPPIQRLVHWVKGRFHEANQQFRKQSEGAPTNGPDAEGDPPSADGARQGEQQAEEQGEAHDDDKAVAGRPKDWQQ
ncbi:MAG: hypothetical protein MUF01_02195 [Bryobacterales bacterium]|jgi:UPF0716 family protein affecting phage T7 exclusion|nr:hypothetical protein [Bryobacterales bacterium]